MALGPDILAGKVDKQVAELESQIDDYLRINFGGGAVTIYLRSCPLIKTQEILRQKYEKVGWGSVQFKHYSDQRDGDSWSIILSESKGPILRNSQFGDH